jgi:hypothetical protein
MVVSKQQINSGVDVFQSLGCGSSGDPDNLIGQLTTLVEFLVEYLSPSNFDQLSTYLSYDDENSCNRCASGQGA